MTIAEILKKSFQLIWRNIVPFLGIALIGGLAMFLMMFVAERPMIPPPKALKMLFSARNITLMALSWLVFTPVQIAVVHLSSEYFLGRRPSSAGVIQKVRASFIPALGTSLLVTTWICIPLVALCAGTYYSHRFLSGLQFSGFWFEFPFGLAIAALLVAWSYVALTYCIFLQTVVLEGKWGMSSLKRCRELMRVYGEKKLLRGNVARSASLVLHLMLIGFGVVLIFVLISLAFLAFSSLQLIPQPTKSMPQIMGAISGVVSIPVAAVVFTLFYYDIRNRGEAGNLPQGVSP